MGYLSNFMEVRPILCPPARERRRGSRKVGNGHVESVALGPIFWPPKFITYSTPPQSLLSRRTCRTKAVRESNICPNFGENAAIKHRHKTPPTRFFAAIDIRTSQMRYHCKARVRPTRHDRLQPSLESSSSSPPCGRAKKWIKAAETAQINDRKRNSVFSANGLSVVTLLRRADVNGREQASRRCLFYGGVLAEVGTYVGFPDSFGLARSSWKQRLSWGAASCEFRWPKNRSECDRLDMAVSNLPFLFSSPLRAGSKSDRAPWNCSDER